MAVSKVRILGAAAAAVALSAGAWGPAALAADGPPALTNTETVNIKMNASGEVQVARVYDQISIDGTGSVAYANPVSTEGLRNLDGFGSFAVEDGSITGSVDLDGQYRQRAVSTFDKTLPVTVTITYRLDGADISPADLVGKTGTVEVSYRIENVTGVPTDVTVADGAGVETTTSMVVFEPLAGSLALVLPSSYVDVQAKGGGVVAGDGRGGSKMSFSLTLIPPLGNPVAEVGFTANVRDAVVPPADLTIIPVVVANNPTLSGASESFKGGAETGAELTAGAQQIDDNLLKLSAGAGLLLGGLIKLDDGAAQLAAGLNDTAVPGADALAEGSAQVAGGLDQLDAKVPALATGVNDLNAGAEKLAAGLDELAAGLDQLADPQAGLPAATDGAKQLSAGAKALAAGFDQLVPGLQQASAGADQLAAGLPQAKGGVDQVKAGLDAALVAGGSIDQLQGGVAALKGYCGPNPACVPTADQVLAGINTLRTETQQASAGLGQVSAGLATAVTGANQLATGLSTQLVPGAQQLQAGTDQLVAGLDDLVAGLTTATAGVLKLSAGADQLSAGADQLAAGTETLDASVPALESGVNELTDGANQVAEGNAKLARGVSDAADGASQISDGLGTAAGAVPQIEDGAKRLSEEGTKKLIVAGNATALDFGERYAVLSASAERTADGGLPFGAPANATVQSAAYSFDIAGESGKTRQNTSRLVIALLVASGAAVGATIIGRRLV